MQWKKLHFGFPGFALCHVYQGQHTKCHPCSKLFTKLWEACTQAVDPLSWELVSLVLRCHRCKNYKKIPNICHWKNSLSLQLWVVCGANINIFEHGFLEINPHSKEHLLIWVLIWVVKGHFCHKIFFASCMLKKLALCVCCESILWYVFFLLLLRDLQTSTTLFVCHFYSLDIQKSISTFFFLCIFRSLPKLEFVLFNFL
jgi:hypothetical protein